MRYLITGGLYLSRLTAAEKKILREAGIRTRTWLDIAVDNLNRYISERIKNENIRR
jgi:hypothetical protein